MQTGLRDALRRHPRAVGVGVVGGAVVLPAVAVGLAIAVIRAPQATGDEAFETLRLMRQWGVHPLANEVDPAPLLTVDRFGPGNFTTDAGWFSFWLTPRSPDGYPSCSL